MSLLPNALHIVVPFQLFRSDHYGTHLITSLCQNTTQGTSWRVGDAQHYIIIEKLLIIIFNILPLSYACGKLKHTGLIHGSGYVYLMLSAPRVYSTITLYTHTALLSLEKSLILILRNNILVICLP
jgi:hypothetical protein